MIIEIFQSDLQGHQLSSNPVPQYNGCPWVYVITSVEIYIKVLEIKIKTLSYHIKDYENINDRDLWKENKFLFYEKKTNYRILWLENKL